MELRMKYETIEGIPSDDLLASLITLENVCFLTPQYNIETLKYEMSSKKHITTIIARDKKEILGYKIGYERKNGEYYSWLGGVSPSARGQGIARKLMQLQHKLLKEIGYKRIRTQTGNEFRAMLILNLKSGFLVIGTLINSKNRIRITLEKKL